MTINESQNTSRRAFLRAAGFGTAALIVAACGSTGTSEPTGPAADAVPTPAGSGAAAADAPIADTSATPAAADSNAAAPPAAGSVSGTLKLAVFGSQETADNTSKLLAGFTKENPDIKIEVTPYQAPDWDGFFQKLLTQVAAGQTPDVVTVATEGAHLFAGKGLAAPLDDYVKRDKDQLQDYFSDVSPALIEAMMYDGSLYCMPDNFNAANLFYSKTAFDAKGVGYPTEWTKDDFMTNMPTLTGTGDGGTKQFGYFWTNRMWGGAIPWMFLNGSNVLNEDRFAGGSWLWDAFYSGDEAAKGRGGGYKWDAATANTPENVEALQLLVDLTYKLQAAPTPAEADSAQSQVRTLFATGQLATFPSGGYFIRGLSQDKVDPSTYGVTFMPKWKTQRHQFGTAGFFIMDKSENKDAAWELAKWRIGTEAMTGQFPFGSSVPARRSLSKGLFEDTYGFKDYQVFYDTFDKFPDTAPIPQPPQANQITASFVKNIGLAMTQDQTPQQALDTMQQEFEQILKA